MRITRIDFEGEFGNYATAIRQRDSQYIKVTIFIPGTPDGRRHHVLADSEEDIFSMAECLASVVMYKAVSGYLHAVAFFKQSMAKQVILKTAYTEVFVKSAYVLPYIFSDQAAEEY